MQQITLLSDAEWQSSCQPQTEDACFGSLATERGHLPLEAMDVRAHITGLSFRLALKQTFVNNLGTALEAAYIFPLPPRAAVTEFRLRVAGREVAGEIQERGKARAAYDKAIATGHRAAIAEEDRSGVFNMRVGNLMPGDRAEVELILTGPLELDGATATFRFPLVVAPRYIPGTALAGGNVGDGTEPDTDVVPDASRISPPVLLPGYPNPVRLSIRAEIDPAGLTASNMRCALHAVTAESRGQTKIIEVRPGERLNRDFILRFDIATEDLTTCIYASPDESGEGGTFCLTAVPPKGAVAGSKPRDVVFVLDRSGSMGGWKMVAARRAVARMIDALGRSDRFSVLAFDNSIETCPGFGQALIDATDRNRYQAIEFLAKIEARGGTEMYNPLLAGAKMLGKGYRDRERVMVLVTDGQVGNEDQILRDLDAHLGARLFTVGVDRAVNEGFLRRLAALGAGSCSLVESEDRLDETMDMLQRRIGEPVITEMAIAGDGFEIDRDSVVPKRLPDLFAASPTIIYGRYRGKISGQVTLTGTDMAGGRYERKLSPTKVESAAAASIWARGRIRALEDDYAIGRGRSENLAAEITGLSLRHKVLCRFTAFVAVDRAVVVNAGGNNVKVVQPVETPEGWAGADLPDAVVGGLAKLEEVAEMYDDEADGFAAPVFAQSAKLDAAPPAPSGGAPMPQSRSSAMPAPSSPRYFGGGSIPGGPPAPKPAAPKKRKSGRGLVERARRMLSRNEAPEERSVSSAEVRVGNLTSLIARVEQIALRHEGRAWLDAAVRKARLLIEIDELIADLESFGGDARVIKAVKQSREKLEASDPGQVESVLEELVAALSANAPTPSADSGESRADKPFWR